MIQNYNFWSIKLGVADHLGIQFIAVAYTCSKKNSKMHCPISSCILDCKYGAVHVCRAGLLDWKYIFYMVGLLNKKVYVHNCRSFHQISCVVIQATLQFILLNQYKMDNNAPPMVLRNSVGRVCCLDMKFYVVVLLNGTYVPWEQAFLELRIAGLCTVTILYSTMQPQVLK